MAIKIAFTSSRKTDVFRNSPRLQYNKTLFQNSYKKNIASHISPLWCKNTENILALLAFNKTLFSTNGESAKNPQKQLIFIFFIDKFYINRTLGNLEVFG